MKMTPIQWKLPPPTLPLTADYCHVWKIKSGDLQNNILSFEEQTRAARLISPQKKMCFIQAHTGLRHILSRYTGHAPPDILFSVLPGGKPVLKHFPTIFFNLSHSHELALCVVANYPVGIDVQYQKNIQYKMMAKRFFNENEMVNNKADFFTLWTQKEAYLKSQGRGLAGGIGIDIREKAIPIFIPDANYIAAVTGHSVQYYYQE